MSFTTGLLTGTYQTWDGIPASGTIEIIPNSPALIDAEGDVILSGRVKVALDETGSFSEALPATDDATVEPATGRQYTVVAKLRHQHLKAVTGIELAGGETVDMADVTSAAETTASLSLFLTAEEYAAVVDRVADLEVAAASAGRRLDSPVALLADTSDALGVGKTWLAGGYQYVEAASGASDHHVTTAGGVKLYVVPTNGAVELAAWGVTAGPSVTAQLLAAADIAGEIVLPPITLTVASKPTIDADLIGVPGSVINFTMASGRGLDMAAGRQIRGVKFTSPYAGPSSAADAVDGASGGKYDYGSRSIGLNAGCHIEDCEIENASQGIHVLGSYVTGRRLNIHNIRHFKGWGAAIHRDTAAASYSHFADVQITDCDRGTETEAGASYNLTEHVTYTRVGPSGYTGQGAYEVYSFVVDAHSHTGEGACIGNVYRDLKLVDCMGGITCVRSNGTNDSDHPRDNVFEDITIEGYASVTGYEAVYIQGHNNQVRGLKMRLGSGVTSKMVVLIADAGSNSNVVEIDEASAYALPLVKVGSNNTTWDNRIKVKRVSPPTTGSGYLIDVFGLRTVLDLSIRDVTGTTGYLRINGTAIGSSTTRFDYSVAAGETFAAVALLTPSRVQLRGIEGINAATAAVKDISTSGGITYLTLAGALTRTTAGTSVDLGGASAQCDATDLTIANGLVVDSGTNNIVPRQGEQDFESTFGADPGLVASILAGGSVNLVTASAAAVIRRRAVRRMVVTRLRWVVGTQSGNYDVGIYDTTGARLWSKGSTAVPVAGTVVTETVTGVDLPKGARYYVAIVFDNTTATTKGVTLGNTDMTRDLKGNPLITSVASAFPLPTPITVGTSAVARLPLLTLHEA